MNNAVKETREPESSISVRRTSPVDLNLGESAPPSVAVTPLLQVRRNKCNKVRMMESQMAGSGCPPVSTAAPCEDQEELGALRHLATELHNALRLSEEENVVLKGTFILPLLHFSLFHFQFFVLLDVGVN